jgi:hypothetical protein
MLGRQRVLWIGDAQRLRRVIGNVRIVDEPVDGGGDGGLVLMRRAMGAMKAGPHRTPETSGVLKPSLTSTRSSPWSLNRFDPAPDANWLITDKGVSPRSRARYSSGVDDPNGMQTPLLTCERSHNRDGGGRVRRVAGTGGFVHAKSSTPDWRPPPWRRSALTSWRRSAANRWTIRRTASSPCARRTRRLRLCGLSESHVDVL